MRKKYKNGKPIMAWRPEMDYKPKEQPANPFIALREKYEKKKEDNNAK